MGASVSVFRGRDGLPGAYRRRVPRHRERGSRLQHVSDPISEGAATPGPLLFVRGNSRRAAPRRVADGVSAHSGTAVLLPPRPRPASPHGWTRGGQGDNTNVLQDEAFSNTAWRSSPGGSSTCDPFGMRRRFASADARAQLELWTLNAKWTELANEDRSTWRSRATPHRLSHTTPWQMDRNYHQLRSLQPRATGEATAQN